jgi:hypothetical protein
MRALAKTHEVVLTTSEAVLRRAESPNALAKMRLAAFYLHAAEQNDAFSYFKVDCMRAAAIWLTIALVFFLLLGIALASYMLTTARAV